MSSITNETEFKNALDQLTLAQQRRIGALFVENVLTLCDDYRVKNALNATKTTEITPDELAAACRAAKTASIESFTQCGKDVDWLGQAGHFVAAASVACVTPANQIKPTDNIAWTAAMHGRMARMCETIAAGKGSENQETQQQYQILVRFLETL
jgi:hypothetical protein